MKAIKALTSVAGKGFSYMPGDEDTVEDGVADRLEEAGFIEVLGVVEEEEPPQVIEDSEDADEIGEGDEDTVGPVDRETLEAALTELGIRFQANWKTETLVKKLEEAKQASTAPAQPWEQ